MRPLRRLMQVLEGPDLVGGFNANDVSPVVGPVTGADVSAALSSVRPSASKFKANYEKWKESFGADGTI